MPENQQTEKTCSACGKPLYKDWTNRGQVTRCRNIQCHINEEE